MTEALTREFNASLVRANIRLNIRAYVRSINAEVFKQPIDNFADDLLDLVIQDDFCIPHDKLMQYGVLSSAKPSDVVRLLGQHDYKEGLDFRALMRESSGGRPAKIYYLKPETFEQCLMRARNTTRYSKFFGLLKKCITLYDKYQIALKEQEIMMLAEQNTRLDQMLKEMREANGITTENFKEVKTELRAVHTKVDNLQGGINEIKTQLDTVAAVADSEFRQQDHAAEAAVETAADIATPPEKPADADSLILLRLSPRKYMACRIQVKAAARTIRQQKAKYPNIREVLHLTDCANGKYLWNNCKAALKGRIKMTGASPTIFTLEGATTEQEVIDELNKLYDQPVKLAKIAGAATKARVAASRMNVGLAKTAAGGVVTRVTTTTTVTETFQFGDEDFAELEQQLLN